MTSCAYLFCFNQILKWLSIFCVYHKCGHFWADVKWQLQQLHLWSLDVICVEWSGSQSKGKSVNQPTWCRFQNFDFYVRSLPLKGSAQNPWAALCSCQILTKEICSEPVGCIMFVTDFCWRDLPEPMSCTMFVTYFFWTDLLRACELHVCHRNSFCCNLRLCSALQGSYGPWGSVKLSEF